jgi:hypothetical protein
VTVARTEAGWGAPARVREGGVVVEVRILVVEEVV